MQKIWELVLNNIQESIVDDNRNIDKNVVTFVVVSEPAGRLSQTWINFNPSMDKWSYA